MMRTLILAPVLFGLLLCCGCGQETVVVEQTLQVDQANPKSWAMEPGRYMVEMTATGNGATLDFAGTSRDKASGSKQFSNTILFSKPGEIKLSNDNPEVTTVTIKITKVD